MELFAVVIGCALYAWNKEILSILRGISFRLDPENRGKHKETE